MSTTATWDQSRPKRRGVVKHLTTAFWAAASVGVFVGAVTWAYNLGVRNPMDVPALGPAREAFKQAPAEPGGVAVSQQGLDAHGEFGDDRQALQSAQSVASPPERHDDADQDVARRQYETGAIVSMASDAAREVEDDLARDGMSERRASIVDLDTFTPRAGGDAIDNSAQPDFPPNVGAGSEPFPQPARTALVGPSAPAPSAASVSRRPQRTPDASSTQIGLNEAAASSASQPSTSSPAEQQPLTERLSSEGRSSASRSLTQEAAALPASENSQPDISSQTSSNQGGVDQTALAEPDLVNQAGLASPQESVAVAPPPRRRPATIARLGQTPESDGVPVAVDIAPGARVGVITAPEATGATIGRVGEPRRSQPAARTPTVSPVDTDARYAVQLAALRSEAEVERRWREYQQREPDLLGGKELIIQAVSLATGPTGEKSQLYRLRVGFQERREAQDVCNKLRERGFTCFTDRL